MGVNDVEWGDFFSPSSVGSPASSGPSGNGSNGNGSSGNGSSDDGFDTSGVFIGEGWGGNPPEDPAPTTPKVVKGTAAEVLVAAAQEAEDKAKTEIIKPKTDFSLTGVLSNMNMGKYAEAAAKGLFGWVKHPKAKQFTNLNDLAIIKAILGGASGESVDEYYKNYKDIINEGLGLDPDDPWGLDEFSEALWYAPDLGVEGEESQRRLDKVSFYEDQISPQTKGGLEKLAGETIITGGNLSPEEKAFNQKVFNARNELDRQWGDQGGQDGGQGIADLSPVAQLAATTPEEVAAATVPAEVAAATTTPAATTTAAATEPTPFDYSQWPQFTSAYPGYNQYPWPNYVNQGLGQWPNFDYWNQIANAFPGMSQYG